MNDIRNDSQKATKGGARHGESVSSVAYRLLDFPANSTDMFKNSSTSVRRHKTMKLQLVASSHVISKGWSECSVIVRGLISEIK